jgi:Ner family transcriptional regulator
MSQISPLKKPTHVDWHNADIVAALHKAGWTIRKLSVHHGYASPTQLSTPLQHSWPKGERLIAAAIGIDPAEIWPSRYLDKSSTTRKRRAA